eukprot:tig00020603_g11838.t1
MSAGLSRASSSTQVGPRPSSRQASKLSVNTSLNRTKSAASVRTLNLSGSVLNLNSSFITSVAATTPKTPQDRQSDSRQNESRQLRSSSSMAAASSSSKHPFDHRLYKETGLLTPESFAQSLARWAPHLAPQAVTMFDALDHYGDGYVTFREFLAEMHPTATDRELDRMLDYIYPPPAPPPKPQPSEEQMDEVRAIFDVYNKSKTGYITFQEFREAAGDLMSDEEAREAFLKHARPSPPNPVSARGPLTDRRERYSLDFQGDIPARDVEAAKKSNPPGGESGLDNLRMDFDDFFAFFEDSYFLRLSLWGGKVL